MASARGAKRLEKFTAVSCFRRVQPVCTLLLAKTIPESYRPGDGSCRKAISWPDASSSKPERAREPWAPCSGARSRELDTLVALKTFRIDRATPLAPRFAREVAALADIDHEGVVRYVAHGESDGQPFLAMAWIDGPTLAERLAERGLTPGEALRLARRLAGALSGLHARGIVHRDLKPSNVMLPGDQVDALASSISALPASRKRARC